MLHIAYNLQSATRGLMRCICFLPLWRLYPGSRSSVCVARAIYMGTAMSTPPPPNPEQFVTKDIQSVLESDQSIHETLHGPRGKINVSFQADGLVTLHEMVQGTRMSEVQMLGAAIGRDEWQQLCRHLQSLMWQARITFPRQSMFYGCTGQRRGRAETVGRDAAAFCAVWGLGRVLPGHWVNGQLSKKVSRYNWKSVRSVNDQRRSVYIQRLSCKNIVLPVNSQRTYHRPKVGARLKGIVPLIPLSHCQSNSGWDSL